MRWGELVEHVEKECARFGLRPADLDVELVDSYTEQELPLEVDVTLQGWAGPAVRLRTDTTDVFVADLGCGCDV